MSEQFNLTDVDPLEDGIVLTEVPEIDSWSLEHFEDVIG
jgi:hypothetical protein